jgi:LacI family transcriptional regulator
MLTFTCAPVKTGFTRLDAPCKRLHNPLTHRPHPALSQEKATIHTIAKSTGLSLATVSRALAGSPILLPQTRDKVLEAARDCNYVRDRAAVRLKTGKTHVLAFVMDRFDASQPGFKDLLLGLGDAIAGTDYPLIVL